MRRSLFPWYLIFTLCLSPVIAGCGIDLTGSICTNDNGDTVEGTWEELIDLAGTYTVQVSDLRTGEIYTGQPGPYGEEIDPILIKMHLLWGRADFMMLGGFIEMSGTITRVNDVADPSDDETFTGSSPTEEDLPCLNPGQSEAGLEIYPNEDGTYDFWGTAGDDHTQICGTIYPATNFAQIYLGLGHLWHRTDGRNDIEYVEQHGDPMNWDIIPMVDYSEQTMDTAWDYNFAIGNGCGEHLPDMDFLLYQYEQLNDE